MADALTPVQAARAELHKSSYWNAAQKQKGNNHLWLTDVHLGEAIAALTTPLPPPVVTPPSGVAPKLALVAEGGNLSGFSNLDKYSLVIVSAGGIADAKAKCPKALKLLYSNASQIVSSYSEGLDYTTADKNAGWLLGAYASGRYVVNHANPDLNEAMAQAVCKYVLDSGMDGCFLDDTIPMNPYGYVTPTGWRDGMVSFAHRLRDLLHASGKKLYCNANGFADPSLGNGDTGASDIAWAKMLMPDGVMEENWAQSREKTLGQLRGRANAWNADWDQWESTAYSIMSLGLDFIGLTYNPTPDAHTYGAASLMLVDTGRAYIAGMNSTGGESWGQWAVDVLAAGAPIDPPIADTSKYAKPSRKFANRTATVDPVAITATIK